MVLQCSLWGRSRSSTFHAGAIGQEVPLVEEEPLLHADREQDTGRDDAHGPEHHVRDPCGAARRRLEPRSDPTVFDRLAAPTR